MKLTIIRSYIKTVLFKKLYNKLYNNNKSIMGLIIYYENSKVISIPKECAQQIKSIIN